MSFEKPGAIPEKNELPLDISKSEILAQGGESTAWKASVKNEGREDKHIALKEVRREQFASDAEMHASKEFYDFLKNFPKFGKFVPDTLYFKARMSPDSNPRAYSIQQVFEGKSMDKFGDDELYKDPTLVRELLEFANGAIRILQETRERGMIKPDLGRTADSDTHATILSNYLLNPRWTSNVVITERPDENGQRVFFVDTGMNAEERTHRSKELAQRHVVSPIQELQLKRWAKKLEEILDKKK